MKKILFVIDALSCDGASKSLVTLLSELDYNMYNVDLMILNDNNSFFLPMVPVNVKMISTSPEVSAFFQPLVVSIKRLIKLQRFDL